MGQRARFPDERGRRAHARRMTGQTVTLQFRIRPDRRLSERVWENKQRSNQAYNAAIAYLLAHEERDAKGYRQPQPSGRGLYKELKHLLKTDPAFAGMLSYDFQTGLDQAAKAYEQRRRSWNDKRKKRRAYKFQMAEYREGQRSDKPDKPKHRYRAPETLFRRRKDRERGESFGRRYAYECHYKPRIKSRHRVVLPGLGEVAIQGTIEARLRDLFPGRRIEDWKLLSSYQLADITRKITCRTRPGDRRYKLHLQVEVKLRAPRPVAEPVFVGCDPGVRVDRAVAQQPGGPVYAFLAPKGLKKAHGDAYDQVRNARAVNTRKHSRKYNRLSRQMTHMARRRTNRTLEWERHVACELVDLGDVIGLEGADLVQMTRNPSGTKKRPGHLVDIKRARNRNLRYARAGALRAAIAARGTKQGKVLHNIDPKFTSRQCAACGYIDERNRKSQAVFRCRQCGHDENADANAARNFAAAALLAWCEDAGTCPVPRERLGGPSGPLTAASAPVTERRGGGSRSRSLAVLLSDPRKPPDPSDPADLDPPIRRDDGRPP